MVTGASKTKWNIRAYDVDAHRDAPYGDGGTTVAPSPLGSSRSEPLTTILSTCARVAASRSSTVATRFAVRVGYTAARDRSPRTAPARWSTTAGSMLWMRFRADPGSVRSQVSQLTRSSD